MLFRSRRFAKRGVAVGERSSSICDIEIASFVFCESFREGILIPLFAFVEGGFVDLSRVGDAEEGSSVNNLRATGNFVDFPLASPVPPPFRRDDDNKTPFVVSISKSTFLLFFLPPSFREGILNPSPSVLLQKVTASQASTSSK